MSCADKALRTTLGLAESGLSMQAAALQKAATN